MAKRPLKEKVHCPWARILLEAPIRVNHNQAQKIGDVLQGASVDESIAIDWLELAGDALRLYCESEHHDQTLSDIDQELKEVARAQKFLMRHAFDSNPQGVIRHLAKERKAKRELKMGREADENDDGPLEVNPPCYAPPKRFFELLFENIRCRLEAQREKRESSVHGHLRELYRRLCDLFRHHGVAVKGEAYFQINGDGELSYPPPRQTLSQAALHAAIAAAASASGKAPHTRCNTQTIRKVLTRTLPDFEQLMQE